MHRMILNGHWEKISEVFYLHPIELCSFNIIAILYADGWMDG